MKADTSSLLIVATIACWFGMVVTAIFMSHSDILGECEKNLPRTVKCKLIAVPDERK